MKNYLMAIEVMLAFATIIVAKGQPTAHVCENGDSSNSIAAELSFEAIQQLNMQLHSIREILTESNLERKSQLDNVRTSLQAVDRRSQEQIQSIKVFLNDSVQQIKNQLNTAVTSLQTIDRRSQEQDISIRKVQSSNEFLNVSFQQMKNQLNTAMTSRQADDRRSQDKIETIYRFLNSSFKDIKYQQNIGLARCSQEQVTSMYTVLNASFDQMKGQQDTVLRKLETLERDHSVIKNLTEANYWKLEIALVSGVGEVPVLQPIASDWIILMQRFDGSLNFNRSWNEYKNGFGDMGRGEFWIGNEKIHRLTKRFDYTLRIEMYINGTWYYAKYTNFSIESESSKYTLRLSGFSGNAGDSLSTYHDGMSFTTRDIDNDKHADSNCALSYDAGWWFNYCELACLTCSYNGGFRWFTLRHLESSGNGRLRAARMMIKSK